MKKISVLSILVAAFSLLFAQASYAACGEIQLGSAISLTGKYATNGIHAKNGYEYAIQKIKDKGGVMIDGKCYNFKVTYYDARRMRNRRASKISPASSPKRAKMVLWKLSRRRA